MKNIDVLIKSTMILFIIMIFINGCAVTQSVADKTGSQLWGENCGRCHNAPMSNQYSATQWETIGMHMQMRANLTDDEAKKIVSFLQAEQ